MGNHADATTVQQTCNYYCHVPLSKPSLNINFASILNLTGIKAAI